MRRVKGMSLVELLIAMTLGLVLMTGVIQVFLSSRVVYSTQQALSRIQEGGRLAMDFIAEDVRMAGFMGCMTREEDVEITNTLNSANGFLYNFNEGIRGYTDATLPAGSTLAPAPAAGTDVLVIRSASGNGATVDQNNNGAQVFVTNTSEEAGACPGGTTRVSGICEGDILVISDCSKAIIFQATNVAAGNDGTANVAHSNGTNAGPPGNANSGWGGNSVDDSEIFDPGADVIVARTTTYFVAPGASGRNSLWQNSGGQNLELLDGVQDMSLRYGFDVNNDGTPDEYRAAGDIPVAPTNLWSRVRSVRVELLVEGFEDRVLDDRQSYTFAGVLTEDPGDLRMRQVFVNTVGIRGRLP